MNDRKLFLCLGDYRGGGYRQERADRLLRVSDDDAGSWPGLNTLFTI